MNDVTKKIYLFPPAGGKKTVFLLVGTANKDFLQFCHEYSKSTLNFESI